MTFLRITSLHPYLEAIRGWYTHSFPADERRDFDELIPLLAHTDMHFCGLVEDTYLVGFIVYWQWDDILFVEHLAVDPQQRGNQFGQKALALLLHIPCRYVLLEVERPTDVLSQRRIQFYERQGFTLNPFDYVQPPYQPGKAAVPMRSMSIPAISDLNAFRHFSLLIKHRIYERFYE